MRAPTSRRRRLAPTDLPAAAPTARAVQKSARRGECGLAARQAESMARDAPGLVSVLASVADCYQGAGEVPQAIALYRRLSREHADSAAGQTASYEVGRLVRRMGDDAGAKAAFVGYLERYPRGSLAAEAAFQLCSIEVEGTDRTDRSGALSCLRRYRESYPTGHRVAESLMLEGAILRARGDCAGAIRVYDRYLQTPGGYAEQARRWKAWCEQHL